MVIFSQYGTKMQSKLLTIQACRFLGILNFDSVLQKKLNRVPTSTGKPGKPGKSQIKVPCMEKSWNLKTTEKSWKNHGIL